MSTPPRRRSFVWNAAALSAAQLGAPVLNAAMVVLLARWATPEALGQYSVLVTAFMVVDQVRLLGLQRFLTRELAAGRPEAPAQYHAFVRVVDLGALVGMGVFAAYSLATGAPAGAVVAMALGLWPSGHVAANDAVFLSSGRADFTARIVAVEGIVRAVISISILYWRGADLAVLGLVYAAGRLIAAWMGRRYRRRLVQDVAAANPDATRALLAQVPAFFTVTAMPLLLLRADLLVISAVASARDVGFYGAAVRLVAILLVLPDGIMLANFARLAQTRHREALRRAVIQFSAAVLAFVVAPTAVVSVFATPLATAVYGPRFPEAGRYLAWLIWSVPLFLLARALGDALVAAGHQRRLAYVIIATAALSAPIYLFFARALGAQGVAFAYLSSLVILLALSFIAARIILSPSPSLDPGGSRVAVESR